MRKLKLVISCWIGVKCVVSVDFARNWQNQSLADWLQSADKTSIRIQFTSFSRKAEAKWKNLSSSLFQGESNDNIHVYSSSDCSKLRQIKKGNFVKLTRSWRHWCRHGWNLRFWGSCNAIWIAQKEEVKYIHSLTLSSGTVQTLAEGLVVGL